MQSEKYYPDCIFTPIKYIDFQGYDIGIKIVYFLMIFNFEFSAVKQVLCLINEKRKIISKKLAILHGKRR